MIPPSFGPRSDFQWKHCPGRYLGDSRDDLAVVCAQQWEWQPLSQAAFADGGSTVTVCTKAGCLWPFAKLGEKCDMACWEGTIIRNNIKSLSRARGNGLEWCTWKQAQLYLLLMEWHFFTKSNCWGCCLCLNTWIPLFISPTLILFFTFLSICFISLSHLPLGTYIRFNSPLKPMERKSMPKRLFRL